MLSLFHPVVVCKVKKAVVEKLAYHEITLNWSHCYTSVTLLEIGLPLRNWQRYSFVTLLNLLRWNSFYSFFSTGRTSCLKDLNWDCKGWKEGHVMCCWNKILKLFLVMELVTLVCGNGWILILNGAAPIFISHFELSEITLIPLVKISH